MFFFYFSKSIMRALVDRFWSTGLMFNTPDLDSIVIFKKKVIPNTNNANNNILFLINNSHIDNTDSTSMTVKGTL